MMRIRVDAFKKISFSKHKAESTFLIHLLGNTCSTIRTQKRFMNVITISTKDWDQPNFTVYPTRTCTAGVK